MQKQQSVKVRLIGADEAIAQTTLSNLTDLEQGRPCPNEISATEKVVAKPSV